MAITFSSQPTSPQEFTLGDTIDLTWGVNGLDTNTGLTHWFSDTFSGTGVTLDAIDDTSYQATATASSTTSSAPLYVNEQNENVLTYTTTFNQGSDQRHRLQIRFDDFYLVYHNNVGDFASSMRHYITLNTFSAANPVADAYPNPTSDIRTCDITITYNVTTGVIEAELIHSGGTKSSTISYDTGTNDHIRSYNPQVRFLSSATFNLYGYSTNFQQATRYALQKDSVGIDTVYTTDTTYTYSIVSASESDAGTYELDVSNAGDTITSDPVVLTLDSGRRRIISVS